MTPRLFRARFAFVCDRCDLGFKGSRLCGHNVDGRIECAKCLIGEDPDETGTPIPGAEPTTVDPRPVETPPALF